MFTKLVLVLKDPPALFYLLYTSNHYRLISWKEGHRLKDQRVSSLLVLLLMGVSLGELLNFILSKKDNIKRDFYESGR